MLEITEITINGADNPIGLNAKPVVCWKLKSDINGTVQTRYTLSVTSGDKVWTKSGTDESVNIPVDCNLQEETEYFVTVTVCDNYGRQATSNAQFETGIKAFKAEWISDGREGTDGCPVFIKRFTTEKKITRARLYASARGVYVATLNGKRIDNIHMAPGWTSYNNRIEFQSYDVTHFLNKSNELSLTLGKGWYRGVVGYHHYTNYYGKLGAVIAELHIFYEDGTKEVIASDNSWTWTTGHVRDSEIYDGETIDFTHVPEKERHVIILNERKDVLVSQECPPARMMEIIDAKKLIRTPEGDTVIDFGQNLTGFVRAKIKAKRGTKITIRHAEVLDEKGNFYTVNLRGIKAAETVTASGQEDTIQPLFTFHGFRYIAIDGLEKVNLEDFKAVVCYSDIKKTGTFSCSHKGINQLQHNIQWGQKGNFFDIPTDCPQRDERLGWTGDAQVFLNTAAFNMDVKYFFTKWMRDVQAEQDMENGCPCAVPKVTEHHTGSGWGDCCTIIPWNLYMCYGDKTLLKEQYPIMRHWLKYIESQTNEAGLWQKGDQWGDWLSLDGGDGGDGWRAGVGATDIYLIANAFFAHSLKLTIKAADVLGYTKDKEKMQARYEKLIPAFRDEYITKTGRLVSDTQTAAVLALWFDLAEEKDRKRILDGLIANIRRHNDHFVTGFLGTPYICLLLSDIGYHELAGKIVQQEDFPSWLYAVNLGATTIWERWNSMLSDGSIPDTGMTSFNHYAYGCIGEWFYTRLCGIRPETPGYKTSIIAPAPVKGIDSASASIDTVYGVLACAYKKEKGVLKVDVTVPVNTEATYVSPDGSKTKLKSGTYHFEH